ncbi:MAG: GGDEF domain-containing protein [Treponema sp.]|nr:GGDEF domain-containing protein [Treponema sp.]
MKTIVVLIHSLTVEYAVQVLEGITTYYKDKDVRLVIFQIKDPHSTYSFYDYQCWTGIDYLQSNEIDGVIIISGSFAMTVTKEIFQEKLKVLKNKPIISIAMDLGMEGTTYTKIQCNQAFSDVIKHLIEKHNCKKIGFMSANQTISAEATQRFEAYKFALADNKLKYDDNIVFHGAFTQDTGYRVLRDNFSTKEEVNFDALLVANDNMALGCIIALQELGVKIPKDVKVVGFDNTTHAYMVTPKLSTIDQNISQQGYIAAEKMLQKLNGLDIPSEIEMPLSPIYRQSCGCIDEKNLEQIYLDSNGISHPDLDIESIGLHASEKYYNLVPKIDNVYRLFDLIKTSNSLEQLFYTMPYCLDNADMETISVCFAEEPQILEKYQKFEVPKKVHINMLIDNNSKQQEFSPSISFNPLERIFPEGFNNKPGVYLFQTLFSVEKNYGYFITKLTSEMYSVYPLFLKILISSMAFSYEYTQLIQNNNTLNTVSKTDELTTLLNRRGFFDLGQKNIDIAIEMNNKGLVFFIDMDGLKIMNDTYGHDMGDLAIKTQAKVLKQTFRANDIIARLGGDEFVVIAIGMGADTIPKIRKKIEKTNKLLSKEQKLPMPISCSIGVIPFNKKSNKLADLLLDADKLLYEEKRQKHKNR